VAFLPSMTCSMLDTMARAVDPNSSRPIGVPSSSQVRCGVVTGSSCVLVVSLPLYSLSSTTEAGEPGPVAPRY
jgi:hypothetical protein